jgi:hypothetical protein
VCRLIYSAENVAWPQTVSPQRRSFFRILGYADDLVILAPDELQLSAMLKIFAEVVTESGMMMNCAKTKWMRLGKIGYAVPNAISCQGHTIEHVSSFKYLGVQIAEFSSDCAGVRGRINVAWGKFAEIRHILCGGAMPINLRFAIAKTHVFSSALYGCEAMTLTNADKAMLDVFESKVARRIARVKWSDKKSNADVFRRCRAGAVRLSQPAIIRRGNFIAHILKGRSPLCDLLFSAAPDQRRGKRLSFTSQVAKQLDSIARHLRPNRDSRAVRGRTDCTTLTHRAIAANRANFKKACKAVAVM